MRTDVIRKSHRRNQHDRGTLREGTISGNVQQEDMIERVLTREQTARQKAEAFGQLRFFLSYKAAKAALAGVPLHLVHPAYTSQTCSACGHCAKENCKSQASFCSNSLLVPEQQIAQNRRIGMFRIACCEYQGHRFLSGESTQFRQSILPGLRS